jgi:peptidyl-prolyl cis-trans isomerase B (cyclophilin B)
MARAKFDRQVARRAEQARRKRQAQAGVGAGLAVLLIVLGSVWLLGGFDGNSKTTAAPPICEWNPQNAQTNSKLKEVGTPPTKNLPTSGTATMTMTTSQGTVDVALDLAKAPCAGASFTYLSGQGFFNNTSCHQLVSSSGMYALRCGDPTGSGQGGPTYTFFDENLPAASASPTASASASASPTPSASPAAPTYPKGTVAMAADTAGANGSQFYIFYQDSTPQTPQYSIIGTVTTGLDVIDKIAKAGAVDNGAGEKTKPKTTVTIQNLTVVGPATPSATAPAATGTATTAPAATATATPSATSKS